MNLSTGSRLGPYEIVSAVGAGGVVKCTKRATSASIVSSRSRSSWKALAVDPQFRNRFDREARTISQLTHPNIYTLYDVGEHHDSAFLVMDYLEGETLAKRLERNALPLADVLTIAIQIASALDRAHRAGVTDRDLKPGTSF
jgi:serine/threonine protein kinase